MDINIRQYRRHL